MTKLLNGSVNIHRLISKNASLLIITPDDVIVGLTYVVVSAALLILYVPTLYMISHDKVLMKLPVYRLLVLYGFCQVIQIITFGPIAGGFQIANWVCPTTCQQIIGSTGNMAQYAENLLNLLICLNRLLGLTLSGWQERLFDGKKPYFWLIPVWTMSAAWNGIYLARGWGLVYDLEGQSWSLLDKPETPSPASSVLEVTNDYSLQSVTLCFCTAVAVKLIQMRQKGTSQNLGKPERCAIAQMFIICISQMIENLFSDVIPIFVDSRWIGFVGSLLTIIVNGWTPIMYLVLNRTIREKMTQTGLRLVATAGRIGKFGRNSSSVSPSEGQPA